MNFYILSIFAISVIISNLSAEPYDEEAVVGAPEEPEGFKLLSLNKKADNEVREKSTNKIKKRFKVKGKKKKVPKRDLFKEAAKASRDGKVKEYSCATPPVNFNKTSKGAQGDFIEYVKVEMLRYTGCPKKNAS